MVGGIWPASNRSLPRSATGKALEELQRDVRLDEFMDLQNHDAWLSLNIAGVYRTPSD